MEPNAVADIFARDIVSGYDLHKPEREEILRRPFGKQFEGTFMYLRDWMFFKRVAQETYGHNEENQYHDYFKVASDVADPTAGSDIDITIHADSLDSNNKFYPRITDTVMFPNEVTGQIWDIDTTTPSAPVITIKLNDQSENFGALSEDDSLIIISNAWAENTGQPESTVSFASYHDNDAQIIKETIGWTGSEMTNQSWLTINGESYNAYYHKYQEQIDYRMSLKIDGAIQFQHRTTNTNLTDPETGNQVFTTEGIFPYARRRSNPYPVNSGAFAITDFDAIDLIQEAYDIGDVNATLSGSKRYQDIENALKEYHDDTNINYARDVLNDMLYDGQMSKASSVNFKMFTKSGRTHLLKRNKNWSNPVTYGVDGYGMKDWSLFFPLNMNYDAKSGEMLESIGYRYKALGPYNRMMEVWSVGGAGNELKVTEFDNRKVYQRANIGAHNCCGQQWVLVTP